MFALIVEDNSGYNPFKYKIWNGFSQTNNDKLQKVEVKSVLSTPSVRSGGFQENEKVVHAMFYSTFDYAEKESKRINKILAENKEPQHSFIIVSASKLSEMVNSYI